MSVLFARGQSIRVCKKRESQYDDHRECTLQKKANCNMMITLQKKANCIMMIIKKVLACMTCSITSSLPFTDGLSHAALVINNQPFCHKPGRLATSSSLSYHHQNETSWNLLEKPWKPTRNHEKPWNYLEKPWKPTKNHEKPWNYLEKPWKPTSAHFSWQTDRQTDRHTCIIIYISSTLLCSSWSFILLYVFLTNKHHNARMRGSEVYLRPTAFR